MAIDELERIRRKVEEGEPLSEAEFAVLDRAARAQGGPTLRLAVAHALLNAGDERQGLALLERLVRDFPRDLQSRLGLGRALSGLERWGEAEKALKDALGLSPGDPEALKALAVVALRRNELGRARGFVAEVLRRDPFDAEARLLEAELEAAEPDAPAPEAIALKTEFVEALLGRLEARGIRHLRHGKDVLVRLREGGVARVDLGSLYTAYLEGGRPLARTVEDTALELGSLMMGVPATREALLSAVLPVLRDASFRDSATGSVFREGPAGLLVFYVLEDPELVRYLPRLVLESGQATLEELDEAAWGNLGRRPPRLAPVTVSGGTLALALRRAGGLWMLGSADGHDAARLLCAKVREQLARELGPAPYRVGLGRRELVLLCPEEDAAAVAQLEGYPAAPEGLRGRFRLDASGRLAALSAAAG